jgi:hypothetical protein
VQSRQDDEPLSFNAESMTKELNENLILKVVAVFAMISPPTAHLSVNLPLIALEAKPLLCRGVVLH